MNISRKELECTLRVLIHCIGDTRECPSCRRIFVPDDRAKAEAWKRYKRLEKLLNGDKKC